MDLVQLSDEDSGVFVVPLMTELLTYFFTSLDMI